jgi:hypothetical protein
LKKLGYMIFLIAMIFFVGAGASYPEPYSHPGTGMVFPDHLAGIDKGRITDHEKEHPGLGISIGYNGPRITATIYLYTMGMASVPENIDSPAFVAHFGQTAEDVFQAGRQGLWNNVKKTSEDILFIGPPETDRKALCDAFSYSRNNDDLLSKLCLFSYRNHFVKIRFTYGKDIKIKAEETFGKFVETLANEMEIEHNKSQQR